MQVRKMLSFLLLVAILPCSADLPIHCLSQDVVGDWEFFAGITTQQTLPSCGHLQPNTASSMAKLNPADELQYLGARYSVRLLSEIVEVDGRRGLMATDLTTGEQGLWTMVYDEGLEVRFKHVTFFAHFLFDVLPGQKLVDGVNWDAIGKYIGIRHVENRLPPRGSIYECHCNVTSVGWFFLGSSQKAGGQRQDGCFYGERRGAPPTVASAQDPDTAHTAVGNSSNSTVKPSAFVGAHRIRSLSEINPTSLVFDRAVLAGTMPNSDDRTALAKGTLRGASRYLKIHKNLLHARRVPLRDANNSEAEDLTRVVSLLGGYLQHKPTLQEVAHVLLVPMRNVSKVRQQVVQSGTSVQSLAKRSTSLLERKVPKRASQPKHGIHADPLPRKTQPAPKLDELPRFWDWRDQLEGVSSWGLDDLGEDIDQGPCGSCYAHAATLAFQMRLRIALFREHGVLAPVEISWRGPTKCAPWTEGCSGGFSYLIFKHFKERGAPERSTFCRDNAPLTEAELSGTCESIPKCYSRANNVFFAKDYGYIGGYSAGTTEEGIMQEVYTNGPLVLGVNVDAASPWFYWGSGSEGPLITDYDNKRIETEPAHQGHQSWQFISHVVLCVGWGDQERDDGSLDKYWVVRNSWGRDWGHNGYTHMRRGKNDAGLEYESEWVTPDTSRLPPNFLEKMRQKFPTGWGYESHGNMRVVQPAKVQWR